MPLQFDKEPPWAIAVEITVTRPDGDHASRRNFPLTSAPETIDLTDEDVGVFGMVAQMVGREVSVAVMDLITHECDPGERPDTDRLN